MKELERNAVGEMMKPIDVVLVELEIIKGVWLIERIRQMHAYKVLIMFKFVELREEALKKDEALLNKYFDEIRRWSVEKVNRLSALVFHSMHGLKKILRELGNNGE